MLHVLVLFILSVTSIAHGKPKHYWNQGVIKKITTVYKTVPKSVLRDLDNVLISFDKINALPRYYMKKSQACRLKWINPVCYRKGPCNLRTIARGKKIGGDKFNGISGWPPGKYREADLGSLLHNQCRNQFRLVFSEDLKVIFFTIDHYQNFLRIR